MQEQYTVRNDRLTAKIMSYTVFGLNLETSSLIYNITT